MPTIDSNLISLFVQVPLLGIFFLFMRWLLERQDKKEAALILAHATEKNNLTTTFQEQLREQKTTHEKEYLATIARYEAVTNKVMEVIQSHGEAMRVLNKTVEQSTNLRDMEEKLSSMLKVVERGK